MVGFSSDNKEKEHESSEENKKSSDDSFCFSLPEIYDFSSFPFTDSFIDFDPIKEWLEEDPPIGPPPYSMDDFCENDEPQNQENITHDGVKLESLVDFDIGAVEKCVQKGSEEEVATIIDSKVGFIIEEELMRVTLNPELNDFDMSGTIKNGALPHSMDNAARQTAETLNVGDVCGNNIDESRRGSSCSYSSSSSSSSDTSSDDDDDKVEEEKEENPKRKTNIAGGDTEMEEGEIMAFQAEEMVAWSDEHDDEDDSGGNSIKGPIRSMNEIADLPPVPAVNVSLLPHHHTLPVGIISSIMGNQVIVEGVARHNPLSEGSIIWITECRSPLGLVDEIFGPVKNPYYIVRYNSETEVPAGLQKGTQISFVPEFADHVLHNASLYRKGYDASGENDEELSEDAEFSDDENEAEYRRMQKMKKRGTNDDKDENRKKYINTKNRFGVAKHEQSGAKKTQDLANNVSTQHFVKPPGGVSSGTRPNFSSGLMQSHPLPQLGMAPGSSATTSGNVWFSGNLSQPTVGTRFPINLQMQGMPWLQGNNPHPVVQAPFLNVAPFQQNIHMNPSLPSNLTTGAGELIFGQWPAFAPWPGGVSPNFFNQSLFGMGIQGQNDPTLTNIGANVSSSGLQHSSMAQNFFNQSILGMGMQSHNTSTPTYVGANTVAPNGFQPLAKSNPGQDTFPNFDHGTNRGGGRRPYHRGGGRFGGGRGLRPS